MSGLLLRKRYMGRFSGMRRYDRFVAWAIVFAYLAVIVASVWLGNYLLSRPVTVWSVVAMAAVAVFIGTRLRGINNIVHECCHSTFSDHRDDNVAIGRLCTSLLMKTFKKYRSDHLSHHAYNGDYESDAEFAVIEKFGLHEPLTPRTMLRLVAVPLLGRHLRVYSGVNFSAEDGRFFVALKVAFLALMALGVFVAPLTTIFFVILPLFYIYPTLNFWTDCLDHAGLVGAKDELEATRNVLAPGPVRWVFFPRNDSYHLVHHLFPQVPARFLNDAHAELCKDPSYRSQPNAARPVLQGLTPTLSLPFFGKRRKLARNRQPL